MYNNFAYPLPKTPHAEKILAEVRIQAQKMYNDDLVSLPYSKFVKFHENGNRTEYEIPYMLHRKALCLYAAMVLTGENNEKWLPKLCDVIWAVCDEYTWALPAHMAADTLPIDAVTKIDLFAAETSNALSEIYYLVGSLLPDTVKNRMVFELKRRVVDSYLQNRQRWGRNNWSAVCVYGVASTFIYLGLDEEFMQVKKNILVSVDDFLQSYNDDGCCMEGSLYWSYGFGFFSYLAKLLYDYTNGEINLFADEKVKKIAQFGTDSYLWENCVIPFSDSPHTMTYDSGLWSLLAKQYDGICPPDEKYQNFFGDDLRYRFSPFMRNLYWGVESSEKSETDTEKYYPNAQWYVRKKDGIAFVAKGGNNNEPHNHNDVGSFVFLDHGKFILDDVGWQEYTKDYFDVKKRYTDIFCTSSKGHSVPIVDGQLQRFGAEYCATVNKASEGEFEIEMSKAYGLETLSLFTRKFKFMKDGLIVEDEAKGNFADFIERFVTRIEPKIIENGVIIDDYAFTCDKDVKITLSHFDFEPRFTGFDGETVIERAYVVDFEFDEFQRCRFELKKQ